MKLNTMLTSASDCMTASTSTPPSVFFKAMTSGMQKAAADDPARRRTRAPPDRRPAG